MPELEPKPVAASMTELSRIMTQLDANTLGNVHGGVIMREVDNTAAVAAARHADGICVTAAIDELSFLQPVGVGDILVVKASVNMAGRTSMEVGVRVEAEAVRGRERRHTTTAYLVMVHLGPDGQPAEVPPLIAETEDQQRRLAQARIRRQTRQDRIERLGSWRPEP